MAVSGLRNTHQLLAMRQQRSESASRPRHRPTSARPERGGGARVGSSHSRGAALLLVMWLIALLAALVGGFALTARVEYLQGRVLARGVVAEQAARAGIEYAMMRLAEQDARRRWLPDGRAYRWRFNQAQIDLRIVDEQGKIDLNAAPLPLLAALLRGAGLEQQPAERLAGAIIDWRDQDSMTQPSAGAEDADYAEAELPYGAKDAPFETAAELLLVLGMTPQLYARIAPSITVFSGRDVPDPAFASAPVLTAMGMDATAIVQHRENWNPATGQPLQPLADGINLVGSNSGTYSIHSRAKLSDGRESLLRVVVRSGATGAPGAAYQPLQWEEGTSLR